MRIIFFRKYIYSPYLTVSILLLILHLTACIQDSNLIILSNSKIEIGILPDIGGRIMMLKLPGYENMLKVTDEFKKEEKINKPEISSSSDFIEYGGHITWVGPQSQWWTRQNLNKHRLLEKADWPPDPYLTYGENKIISKTDSSVSMLGLRSPISGIQIKKTITINKDGSVIIVSSAENISEENISWDLWMLTRLDGFAKAFVPIGGHGIKELKKRDSEKLQATPYKIVNNYFTFESSIPENNKSEQVQEVHLIPSSNFIAGIEKNQLLIIKFDVVNDTLIHPEHGQVELYNYISNDGKDRLLELEIHSPYRTLAPGATMELKEIWNVYPSFNQTSDEDIVKFLEDIRKREIK